MNVLVTGGGGFLGGAICRQLLSRGDRVAAMQRSPAPALEALGARVIRIDLGHATDLARHFDGMDAVIHTAGKAGVWGPYETYHRVNVTGTERVLEACRAAGVPHLVFTSSPSVAHGGGDIEGADESLPYPEHYASPYPATKAQAERAVLAANGANLDTVALRPHLIWGPGDPHLLPRLLQRVRRGRLALPGAGKLIDTVFVENAAEAHLLALDRLRRDGACAGRAYFISNGEPRAQGEIVKALLEAAGIEVEIRPVPPWAAMTAARLIETAWKWTGREREPPITRWSAEQLCTAHWYDLSAARADLGYRPRVGIDEGLARLRASFA